MVSEQLARVPLVDALLGAADPAENARQFRVSHLGLLPRWSGRPDGCAGGDAVNPRALIAVEASMSKASTFGEQGVPGWVFEPAIGRRSRLGFPARSAWSV
jgi:hypothetical protein